MKILHTVQLYHPHVGGSEEVVKQLSERLARRGHDVTVATGFDPVRDFSELNGVKVVQFKILGNEANGIKAKPSEVRRYQEFILRGGWDVMMNYAAHIWSSDLVFPLLPRLKFAKVFVPCGYAGLQWPGFEKYFQKMPEVLKNYDTHVYMSNNYQDKEFADQHGVRNTAIILNAASEEEFSREPLNFRNKYGIRSKYMLLTVANHYADKGHQFVIDAFRRLGRNDTTLVIIGRPAERWWRALTGKSTPFRLALDILGRSSKKWERGGCYLDCKLQSITTPRLKVLRVPRPWTVSAFQEADLFVFGSRIECSPLVIIEAMAAGIPFVSTDCGDVFDRKEFGRIVNTPQEMAKAVNDLLSDEEGRKKLGKSGRREWEKKHTWEAVTDQYESLYEKLVKSK